jgi:cell division protein FtsZ
MDFYSMFDNQEDQSSNELPFHAGNESTSANQSALNDTPFPVTEKDPLGLAGNLVLKQNDKQKEHTQTLTTMKFDIPEHSSIIKVIGVGGGGSNAVNHMYRQGINGVDFIVCNTDKQSLDISPVPHKVVLGVTLTEGRGAGSIPEVGRNSAIENIEDIRSILANNTKMVFITAGMGGGTGTGAAPIIAGIAREMGILTVAIVTVPFIFEGKKRRQQAEEGLEQLKQNVDTLLVICNDKLREMYGNLKLSDAFSRADDVLSIAAKSIAEIISLTQQINVDFADICTVMRNSGVAIMGSSTASGENRSIRAVEAALNSPLLNDNNIVGARYVLLNIVSGSDEITMDELGEITDYIQEAAGQTAEIIKGYGVETSLGESVCVTIIATGFNQNNPVAYEYTKNKQPEKVVLKLEGVATEPVAELKTEKKPETVNPLEPFLINKQQEPVSELKSEPLSVNSVAEITNPLEPFLIIKEEEILSEITEEPVSEVVTENWSNTVSTEEVVSEIESSNEVISEISSEEPIAEFENEMVSEISSEEPIAEFENEMVSEISSEEPIAEFENEIISEISSEEPVAEFENEIVDLNSAIEAEPTFTPVVNENVAFEITNLTETVSEENSFVEMSMEDSVESTIDPIYNESTETVSEFTALTEDYVDASLETVSEPVAEIQNEPVTEIKWESVAKLSSESIVDEKAAEEEARKIAAEEIQRKAQERIQRLKELSMKLKTPQGLNEMENEPAYKRRNVQLDNVPHSSESQVSRFTLSENDEKKIEIRPNNSFLHDNVD